MEEQSAAVPPHIEEAKKKERELEKNQREHNSRTKGGDIRSGEIATHRKEHNERVAPK